MCAKYRRCDRQVTIWSTDHIPGFPKHLFAIPCIIVAFAATTLVLSICDLASIDETRRYEGRVRAVAAACVTILFSILSIGSAAYILASELRYHRAYDYWVILALTIACFIWSGSAGGYLTGVWLSPNTSSIWRCYELWAGTFALCFIQQLLWLVYLIVFAVFMAKHRRRGGTSKYSNRTTASTWEIIRRYDPPRTPDEEQMIEDDIESPSPTNRIPKRGSVHRNANNNDPYHPLRMNPHNGNEPHTKHIQSRIHET